MLSAHDVTAVCELLAGARLHPVVAVPEKIILKERALTTRQFNALRELLDRHGYILPSENDGKIVMQIKAIIIDQVHFSCRERPLDINFSAYLSYELGKAYSKLSHIFSSVEGITIKQFIIRQKTERIKALLYEDLPLSKVALKLSYTSVQHLSAQFKKMTGLTPVQFRQQHAPVACQQARELMLPPYETQV